jgi:hypothetical protein
MAPSQQRLIFNGAEVEDDETLAARGIGHECTLYMVISGCFGSRVTLMFPSAGGRRVTVRATPSETLGAIVEKMQVEVGVPPHSREQHRQRFGVTARGAPETLLALERTLEECGLGPGAKLQLVDVSGWGPLRSAWAGAVTRGGALRLRVAAPAAAAIAVGSSGS